MLMTKFEELRMWDDETIDEFNTKLCEIANKAHSLGEKISEDRLIRKTLRSLSERFAYEVNTIEEAKDVSSMRLDDGTSGVGLPQNGSVYAPTSHPNFSFARPTVNEHFLAMRKYINILLKDKCHVRL